jgi:ABC-type Zn uptake system ZnuABC Zn-binding protein ZnuA
MKNKKIFLLILLVITTIFNTIGCSNSSEKESKDDTNDKISIVTTLFPQYDFAKQIGKDKVDVSLLLPSGVEAHSFEPTPQDIINIQKSNVFIYTGESMEPWADKVIETVKSNDLVVVDSSEGIELMEEEEHNHESAEGEEEHPYEWSGAFDLKSGKYTWSFSKVDGEYADPKMQMVILNTNKSGDEAIESVHEKGESIFEISPTTKMDGDSLTVGENLYELEFDSTKDITKYGINIEKDGTYVFFTQHFPTEFESDEHFLKDSNGDDVEAIITDPEEEDHHHHGGNDPHIWVDPVFAQQMVDNIVEGFIKVDPENESFYRENGEAYNKKLQDLDNKFVETFQNTKSDKIIYAGHFAFGYFAKRYGLTHISPYTGFAPDAEPTSQKIAELIETIEDSGTKVIYYEELIEPKVAKVISEETGTEMVLLHGAHNVSKEDKESGITYLEIMEDNLEKLKKGLGYSE